MNETKGYKNINLSDLGTRQKITQVASRVALFVPRLLGKLATKLIINPITKLATGQTYEQVRNDAVDITMEVQKEQAAALDARIEEGYQNLEEWQEDTDYYISNLGKYKSYQSTIEDLEKKQTRLLSSPKKLLVAKHYRYVMSKFRAKHKEEKAKAKALKKIREAYQYKMAALKEQQDEIRALDLALREAAARYQAMKNDFEQFGVDNANVLGQPDTNEDYVEVTEEPVVEQPEVTAQTDAFRNPTSADLGVEEKSAPVVQPEASVENAGFRAPVAEDLQSPVVPSVVEASPAEQQLFAQMANMAAMGNVPAADQQVLAAYGLSGSEGQKSK